LHGFREQLAPFGAAEKMRQALKRSSDAAKRPAFPVYPHALHEFHADDPESNQREAALTGWKPERA
jgi:hypothetical protein